MTTNGAPATNEMSTHPSPRPDREPRSGMKADAVPIAGSLSFYDRDESDDCDECFCPVRDGEARLARLLFGRGSRPYLYMGVTGWIHLPQIRSSIDPIRAVGTMSRCARSPSLLPIPT